MVEIDYITELRDILDSLDLEDLDMIVEAIVNAHKNNNQIFILGNGGSAALASHFACDLGKGIVKDLRDKEEKRLRVISLTDNVSLMTAISNDISYDEVFSQQLQNLIEEGDIIIGISSSGKSLNVVNALRLGKEKKATTIGLIGFDGGLMKDLVDLKVWVKHNDYGIVEDTHSALMHKISYNVRDKIKQ